MSCARYKDKASVGLFLLALPYPLLFLHALAGPEMVLTKPFHLRPEYEITIAWFLKFLGYCLGLVAAVGGAYCFIPDKYPHFKIAVKVFLFFQLLNLALFFLSFNQYPCEAAMALYLLTLTVFVLYVKGKLAILPWLYYRYFPKDEAELKENQITHPEEWRI